MAIRYQNETIKVYINGKTVEWPKSEYLDYVAAQKGFEDYEDLKAHGYSLNV